MTNAVIVLGGGPAGLGAALQVARRKLAPVTVIEQKDEVGGLSGSFQLAGVQVDYGSHRLHPSCDPSILRDLRQLLPNDLLLRPRHGRIRLRNRWIHFPLKPLDLATRLPLAFTIGAACDLVRKRSIPAHDNFESVLSRGLGRTICRDFYFPYARKVWGVEPAELAADLARRRVSANSPVRMLRKIASAIPGLKPRNAGTFYYPRNGYGQISTALAGAVREAGGDLILGARVARIERTRDAWTVACEHAGKIEDFPCRHVWSTLPVTLMGALVRPSPPENVLSAADGLAFRALILIYLVLDQQQFTEFDAHYFPEETIPLTRLSEPKNYSLSQAPVTVLCAELPCNLDSDLWRAGDQELGDATIGWLAKVDLAVRARVRQVVTRRLPQAYPVYLRGHEERFHAIDNWIAGLPNLLTFGRQGLFAHDNLHHALYMGYSAADCLQPDGTFDRTRWAAFRERFEHHVVED